MTRRPFALVPAASKVLVALALALAAAPAARAAETRIQIILDMSGSMAGAAEGVRKADAARAAVETSLASIPPGTPVALRLYGHRVPREQKSEGCRDSELVIPFQPVDAAAIQAALRRAEPLGQTPIEFALHEAADDFGPPEQSEDAVIILISDGIETCGGDPVALARELKREGFQLKIYTVGFDVDAGARRQLEQVAQVTGATYTDARDSAALTEAVQTVTKTALHGEVVRAPADVAWADAANVRPNVKQQCSPGKALADALADAAPNVQLVDGAPGRQGLTLEMQLTDARVMPGGIFSGTKMIRARGTLRRGGRVIGSFEGQRQSLGGATGLFTGNCGILHHAAGALGRDVAAWLQAPSENARLGDL